MSCEIQEDTGIEKEQVPLKTTCWKLGTYSVRIDLSIGVFFPEYHTTEVCIAAYCVGQCRKPSQNQGILDQSGYHYHN